MTGVVLILSIALNLAGCSSAGRERGVTWEADDEFIASQMDFYCEVFKACAEGERKENMLISPLSLQIALAMTANGADGSTRQEMEALIGKEIPLEELNEKLSSYMYSLPSTRKCEISFANSIWFRNDENRLKVEEDFLQLSEDYYDAQVYAEEFDDETLNDINEWVDKQTDGMIDSILNRIDPSAVMYLINALAFDAEWEYAYEEKDIRDDIFTSASGAEQDVEMMRSTEPLYLDDGRATGFIKDYSGGRYSFAALLPNEGIDIYEYVAGLEAEELLDTLNSAEECSVIANMPKFSCEFQLELKEILKELGMPTAFDESNADFSKMAHSTAGNIFIGLVLQKTFVSVDEEGTEAAATTIVGMYDEASQGGPSVHYEFVTLDRPFVYMIIDNETSLPLFMGILEEIED